MATMPPTVTNYAPNPSFEVDTGLVTVGAGVVASTGPSPASGLAALILTGTAPAQAEADNWAGEAAYPNAQAGTDVTFRASVVGDVGLYARLAIHWRTGATIIFDTFGDRIPLGASAVEIEHVAPAPPGADNAHVRVYISGSAVGATPPPGWVAATDAWLVTRDGTTTSTPTLAEIDAVWAGATLADYDTHWAGSTLAAIDINPLARS